MTASQAAAKPRRTRIGIVEDDPILGAAMGDALAAVADFELVGLAETFADGMVLAHENLDVLLVDLALPDGSGIDIIATARARGAPKTLVFSVFGDVTSVVSAIEAGADGYLLKESDVTQAETAIRTVLAGGAPISPAVARHILARVRSDSPLPRSSSPEVNLTPRERAILELLAKGLSFKDVGRLENISHHTVADHVKAIYRKLSVHSRSEAVFEAVQAGLIKLTE